MSDVLAAAEPLASAGRMSGKVCLVTGGGTGIGRATALRLAQEGAELYLTDRDAEGLEKTVSDAQALGAKVPEYRVLDISDYDEVVAFADHIHANHAPMDVVMNIAGVSAWGTVDKLTHQHWRSMVDINLMGPIHVIESFIPPMIEARRGGHLVNVSSAAGFFGLPWHAAYSASKFGLRGFSEALRAELAGLPNVHVCEVYPTFVDTPGVTHGANYSDHRLSPPPGLVDPRRVAQVLLSLARRPRRAAYVGVGARSGIWAHAVAPNLVARMMMWLTERSLERAEPRPRTDGNLFAPSTGHAIDGGFGSSKLAGRPSAVAGLAATALGAVALAGWWAMRRRRAY